MQYCEPDSGDGAGILIQVPDVLLRRVSGIELPEPGAYATGIGFFPTDSPTRDLLMAQIDEIARDEEIEINLLESARERMQEKARAEQEAQAEAEAQTASKLRELTTVGLLTDIIVGVAAMGPPSPPPHRCVRVPCSRCCRHRRSAPRKYGTR